MPIQDLNSVCMTNAKIASMGNCFIREGFYGSVELFIIIFAIIYSFAAWKYKLPVSSVIPLTLTLLIAFSSMTSFLGWVSKLILIIIAVTGFFLGKGLFIASMRS